jgi:Protein of unknown function (DUF1570)
MRAILVVFFCLASSASAAERRTVEFKLHGHPIQGTPLHWSHSRAQVLSRDGRLWTFSPHSTTGLRQISSSFHSYPASVMQHQLQDELGKSFRVVTTRHYLVALHQDVHTDWAGRFEDLYRSFEMYFSVRGFHLTNPEFPLVAVVWPSHESFLRVARADMPNASNVLGYYSPTTNRITLYDQGSSMVQDDRFAKHLAKSSGNHIIDEQFNKLADIRTKMWENAGQGRTSHTIIHEATHQTAFNTGIHRRFNDTPRWVSEGLAMMFEARGVWDSRTYTRREDRINRDRFNRFRENVAPKQTPGLIEALIASDLLFSVNPDTAYAEAWAFSFFLVETQPRKYCDYLSLTAKRSGHRLEDFVSVFGSNFRLLNAHFLRFMAEVE